MPRPAIGDIRALNDFATVFRWNVIFNSFPEGLSGISSEDLNLRCESSEQPSRAGQTIVQNIRGHQTKHTGIWTYNPITLTFVETEDNKITNFITDWINLSWQARTGTAASKADIQANLTLERLNNQDEPIMQFVLHGAIPEGEDKGGTLDGSTSDFIKPTITLQYDFFEKIDVA